MKGTGQTRSVKMMDRKFITKNIKELGKKRLETLTENQKKQIKKLPKNEREILRLKLMSRKREVRAMVSILNKFFNSTQEFKIPTKKCPDCKKPLAPEPQYFCNNPKCISYHIGFS